jgi:hypothetical protein
MLRRVFCSLSIPYPLGLSSNLNRMDNVLGVERDIVEGGDWNAILLDVDAVLCQFAASELDPVIVRDGISIPRVLGMPTLRAV